MAEIRPGLPHPPCWSPVATATAAEGASQVERAEARAPIERPFMAAQRPSVSSGAWPRGPVVRVSVKQTYLPKGRAAGGQWGWGWGGEGPQYPGLWQGHQGPHFWLLQPGGRVTGCAHTSPCPPRLPSSHLTSAHLPHLPLWVPASMPALHASPAAWHFCPTFPLLRWGLRWGPLEKCSCSAPPQGVSLGTELSPLSPQQTAQPEASR